MPSTFTIETSTAASRERLFDASLSIDAHVDSMSASGERAIAGVTSGQIGLGESVTWRARHFGVWFTMTSRITALERPDRFVDEQTRGPFRVFRHVHEFGVRDGATVMTDTLTVGSPVFGMLVERSILVPYLRRLIRKRNEHLLAHVAAEGSRSRHRLSEDELRWLRRRLERWDVLGVHDGVAGLPVGDDEYSDLTSPIVGGLVAEQSAEQLSVTIVSFLRSSYGLTYDDDLAELPLARDLVEWWQGRR